MHSAKPPLEGAHCRIPLLWQNFQQHSALQPFFHNLATKSAKRLKTEIMNDLSMLCIKPITLFLQVM